MKNLIYTLTFAFAIFTNFALAQTDPAPATVEWNETYQAPDSLAPDTSPFLDELYLSEDDEVSESEIQSLFELLQESEPGSVDEFDFRLLLTSADLSTSSLYDLICSSLPISGNYIAGEGWQHKPEKFDGIVSGLTPVTPMVYVDLLLQSDWGESTAISLVVQFFNQAEQLKSIVYKDNGKFFFTSPDFTSLSHSSLSEAFKYESSEEFNYLEMLMLLKFFKELDGNDTQGDGSNEFSSISTQIAYSNIDQDESDFEKGFNDGFHIGYLLDCGANPTKYCNNDALIHYSPEYCAGYYSGIIQGQKDRCEKGSNIDRLKKSIQKGFLDYRDSIPEMGRKTYRHKSEDELYRNDKPMLDRDNWFTPENHLAPKYTPGGEHKYEYSPGDYPMPGFNKINSRTCKSEKGGVNLKFI